MAGFSLGATWVVARAIIIRLAPEGKIGEIFGLFNCVGYLSAIVGPLFWGIFIKCLSSLGQWGYRITCISLTLFIVIGLVFLLRVPEDKL